jgi:hypothetical protein
MATRKKPPEFTADLIDWLDELFPNKCPDVGMSDREVWIMAGAAQVVSKLRYQHDILTKRVYGNVST